MTNIFCQTNHLEFTKVLTVLDTVGHHEIICVSINVNAVKSEVLLMMLLSLLSPQHYCILTFERFV